MRKPYRNLSEVPTDTLSLALEIFANMSVADRVTLMEECDMDYDKVILELAETCQRILDCPELYKGLAKLTAATSFDAELEDAVIKEFSDMQQKATDNPTAEKKPVKAPSAWFDINFDPWALEEEFSRIQQKATDNPIAEKKTVKKSSVVDRAFDLSVIELDCNYPVDKILNGVKNFAKQLQEGKNKVKNCCILLSGKSGIGKSEFSRYLADATGLELDILRASSLLSKYIGDTEKSIAQAFKTAATQHKILLIDEADSLFQSRQQAEKSWQITQTNEMLCQMEAFEGILICSTNLLDNFDKAVMRRFVFKIKFLDLTKEGKMKLARSYMSEVCDLPDSLQELAEIEDLRPGDFKTVRDRLLIVSSTKVSYATLLDELKAETSYRDDNQLVATL